MLRDIRWPYRTATPARPSASPRASTTSSTTATIPHPWAQASCISFKGSACRCFGYMVSKKYIYTIEDDCFPLADGGKAKRKHEKQEIDTALADGECNALEKPEDRMSSYLTKALANVGAELAHEVPGRVSTEIEALGWLMTPRALSTGCEV